MIHPVNPFQHETLYCVPTAIAFLTGEPFDVVIYPALNRHCGNKFILDSIEACSISAALATLNELGYACRQYKHNVNATVAEWAVRSIDYGYPLLLSTEYHMMVVYDGKIYDTHSYHGSQPYDHAYRNVNVTNCHLIQRQ